MSETNEINEINGRFLDDSEMPDMHAMIDRIINVKFTRRVTDKKGEPIVGGKEATFVIRSDYEVVYTTGGEGYYFRKCYVKPSLKLKYTQLSNTTPIQIMLEVHNLHAFSYEQDSTAEFSLANFPITDIEIHFGYLPQFPKFDDPTKGYTLQDYYDMNGETDVSVIKANVFAVYPIKVPPDSITQFNAIVGSMTTGFVYKGNEVNEQTVYDVEGEKSIMKNIFFEHITRRFVRYSGAKLETEEGILNEKDANAYGVKVFMSDYVKNGHPEYPERYNPQPAEDGGTKKKITILPSKKITRAFENIRDAGFPTLCFIPCFDGNYIAYDIDEARTPSALSNSEDLQKILPKSTRIPAVYSMTFGATRTIKCPFFKLLYPLQEITFQSKYNLSTVIGYFYQPGIGEDKFYCIRCEVEFATVEDVNTMTLVNVDGENK